MANKKPKKKNKKLKKMAPSKKSAAKGAANKKLVKKKSAPKKGVRKTKTVRSKTVSSKTAGAPKKRVAARGRSSDPDPFELQGMTSRSAGQSGDLQGLSNTESADSESVDELVEEGNAFEADVVAGVESAGDDDEKEARTHEVPEDDVPGEYLDED
ncbi:MAG: hypothetical protein WB762_02395 [Candidatus Sulfotelmatobacter sp.]